MVSQPLMTELSIFEALSVQRQCKRHWRPPDLGREETYLLFGSILAQFEGL